MPRHIHQMIWVSVLDGQRWESRSGVGGHHAGVSERRRRRHHAFEGRTTVDVRLEHPEKTAQTGGSVLASREGNVSLRQCRTLRRVQRPLRDVVWGQYLGCIAYRDCRSQQAAHAQLVAN